MSLTLKEKLTRFPPIVCRLLARKHVAGIGMISLTDEEIVAASGLSVAQVKGLCWKKTWEGVDVYEMLAFASACGIDFDNTLELKRNWQRLKGGVGSHIIRSPLWKNYFRFIVEHARK